MGLEQLKEQLKEHATKANDLSAFFLPQRPQTPPAECCALFLSFLLALQREQAKEQQQQADRGRRIFGGAEGGADPMAHMIESIRMGVHVPTKIAF